MENLVRTTLLVLTIISGVVGWFPDSRAAEIPVETFFQRPKYAGAELSPNGQFLAVVAHHKGRNNLEIFDLQKHESRPVTDFDDGDVVNFRWINNHRLLFATGDAEEASGVARFNAWFAVDRDGSRWKRLPAAMLPLGSAHSEDDDEIIVAARWRGPSINDIYRLNAFTARPELLTFDYPGEVQSWIVDRNGVPRIAHSYAKGMHTVWYREADKSPWTKIDEGADFKLHFVPVAFDYDNKTLYVAARRDGDKRATYVYDFESKKLGELVAGSDRADIHALIFNRARRALVGISYEADKPGVVWIDPDMARLQRAVDQALPDTYNALRVADENPRAAVVTAYSDVNPGTIYLLDTEKLALQKLAVARPWLDPKEMAERKPVHYAARDGLDIPAYLTWPKGSSGKNLPLVVIIHGGPWARSIPWRFAAEAQFFASRGYVVFAPDFRGSEGRGWKLLSAGFKQWGLAMQDDITDGVEWLVKQGNVDKDRICLYGGSYGGYATLWGLIKTPELYKCGVASVAVTDVSLLFEQSWLDGPRSQFLDYVAKDMIGDPDKDAEKFRSVSPLVNARRLEAPVLLAYGGKDNRVPIKHGDQFREALDRNGKTYEWVIYREEGHGFNKDENRFDFYRRVDAFLKKYLQ